MPALLLAQTHRVSGTWRHAPFSWQGGEASSQPMEAVAAGWVRAWEMRDERFSMGSRCISGTHLSAGGSSVQVWAAAEGPPSLPWARRECVAIQWSVHACLEPSPPPPSSHPPLPPRSVKVEAAEEDLPGFDLGKKVGRKIFLQKDRRAVVLVVVDASDFDGSLPIAAIKWVACWRCLKFLGLGQDVLDCVAGDEVIVALQAAHRLLAVPEARELAAIPRRPLLEPGTDTRMLMHAHTQ